MMERRRKVPVFMIMMKMIVKVMLMVNVMTTMVMMVDFMRTLSLQKLFLDTLPGFFPFEEIRQTAVFKVLNTEVKSEREREREKGLSHNKRA